MVHDCHAVLMVRAGYGTNGVMTARMAGNKNFGDFGVGGLLTTAVKLGQIHAELPRISYELNKDLAIAGEITYDKMPNDKEFTIGARAGLRINF